MKKTIFLFMITLALFTTACANKNAGENRDSEKSRCCRECLNAWGKSPAAMGPEGAVCGRFMTAVKISEPCKSYFTKNKMTVRACEQCAEKK
jgi:hypothetical protein